jgi:hypothetical protein
MFPPVLFSSPCQRCRKCKVVASLVTIAEHDSVAKHLVQVPRCCISTLHLVPIVIKDLDILFLGNKSCYGMHQVFADCPAFSVVLFCFRYCL